MSKGPQGRKFALSPAMRLALWAIIALTLIVSFNLLHRVAAQLGWQASRLDGIYGALAKRNPK